MGLKKKTGFYTRDAAGGMWAGCSRERSDLQYIARTRDAALSGIRRLFKRVTSRGTFNPTTAPTSKPALTPLTRVVFVLDRSGSMAAIMKDAVASLRANITDLIQKGNELKQKFIVSAIAFDTVTEVLFADHDVVRNGVPSFEGPRARGSTALNDAILRGINISDTQIVPLGFASDYDLAHLVIVITDGHENASSSLRMDVAQRIRELTASDRWTFTFLVPPNYRNSIISQYGVPAGNVLEWKASCAGVREYTAANTSAINNYAVVRSLGQTSVKTFYTDLSGLSTNDVKKKLTDVSREAKVIKVERETDIRPFIEKNVNAPYLPGHAFYQLTKEEKKVHAQKKILVQEKGKSAIYAGDEARELIGIPKGKAVRVVPGNHSNWDVFVQSTSVNRKLVRGSRVVYFPGTLNF